MGTNLVSPDAEEKTVNLQNRNILDQIVRKYRLLLQIIYSLAEKNKMAEMF